MFEELSIPCKLVPNVVGINNIEVLTILKFVICVSGFDSFSKFNLLKVVLVLPMSKEYLGGILSGLVCSTIKFPPGRKVNFMPLYCSYDYGMRY
ncbi:hypothetical protein Goshw_026585 [Gossypium schwendimanii]|uniref:Uncharacterized protein n=1 Tax=Gossypium schwendimanii TaxID=34291 RepID=A0A7J9N6E3_GOSSC|nr:hypothetical protein [Gossypium schwendimanii]